MDFFHIVFDTCLLRENPFGGTNFELLNRRAQQGVAKVYIPLIALEERRTQLLDDHVKLVTAIQGDFSKIQRGQLGMLIEGLSAPELFLPTKEEVDKNSYAVLSKYLTHNKVEVLPYNIDHADNAWGRYFGNKPPFNPNVEREARRKDIPDAWILEAALEVKDKKGRHCALTRDGRLSKALQDNGFQIWDSVEKLNDEIEAATATKPVRTFAQGAANEAFIPLRSPAFDNVGLIVLGINEALNTPDKVTLFDKLESAGIDRAIAEHEARTLVLSGVMKDVGNHLIPVNKAQATNALNELVVQDILLKLI